MKTNLRKQIITALVAIVCAVPAFAQRGEGELDPAKPSNISVDDVIKQFTQKEQSFKEAREQYTWHQAVKVQEMDGDTPDGQFESESDILFDDKGNRIEHVTFAPQSDLHKVTMTQQDFDDIRQRMPFTVTPDSLPEYDIKYLGQQKEDELNTYVFDLAPKTIEKNKRYFEGRIWVDDHDLQIVKTYGKSVPDIVQKHGGGENLFPNFTTWRQQIDGKYWFPVYTMVDDTLHFSTGDVRIRQIVKYTNYRRFGSKVKITFDGKEVDSTPQNGQQAPNGQQPQQQPNTTQPPPK